MKIRCVATPEKITPKIREILNDLDRETFPLDSLYWKERCYWWLVYDDNIPVAFAGLKPLEGKDKGCAFLCRAGVKKSHRGLGLQQKLIRIRIQAARRLGLVDLITCTSKDNYASATNIIRCGFRFYKPNQPWSLPGAMYFYKKL